MVADCGATCAKYILCLFNFVFFVSICVAYCVALLETKTMPPHILPGHAVHSRCGARWKTFLSSHFFSTSFLCVCALWKKICQQTKFRQRQAGKRWGQKNHSAMLRWRLPIVDMRPEWEAKVFIFKVFPCQNFSSPTCSSSSLLSPHKHKRMNGEKHSCLRQAKIYLSLAFSLSPLGVRVLTHPLPGPVWKCWHKAARSGNECKLIWTGAANSIFVLPFSASSSFCLCFVAPTWSGCVVVGRSE